MQTKFIGMGFQRMGTLARKKISLIHYPSELSRNSA